MLGSDELERVRIFTSATASGPTAAPSVANASAASFVGLTLVYQPKEQGPGKGSSLDGRIKEELREG